MLKYFIYIAFFIIFYRNELLSDGCNNQIHCNKAYPYLCCDKITRCYTNPSTATPQVLKSDLPVCLVFDNSGPLEEFSQGQTGKIKVYDKNQTAQDCNCASYNWNCLCGLENTPCQCAILVKFSDNYRDFDNYNDLGKAKLSFTKYGDGSCKVNCNPPFLTYIILNNSNQFKRKDSYNISRYVIASNSLNSSYFDNIASGYFIYDLCYILTHELGHPLGLDHYDQYPCSPYPISSGTMNSKLKANEEFIGLTHDDKCAFILLYCPGLVPVKEQKITSDKKFNYPNPFNSITQIKFNLPFDSKVGIKVFNHLGNQVISYDKWYNAGENTENIDMSEFPAGVYYYCLEIGGKNMFQKMILVK